MMVDNTHKQNEISKNDSVLHVFNTWVDYGAVVKIEKFKFVAVLDIETRFSQ